MARLTVTLHVDRQELHPVGSRAMAPGAIERRTLPESLRHPCDAAASIEMQIVREGQPGRFARVLGERDAGQLVAAHRERQGRSKLRVERTEIGSVAEPGIGQPVLERTVAIGAERLARRRHPAGTLVLGVAVRACAGAGLAERVGDLPLEPLPGAAGPASIGYPRGQGVIVDVFVTSQAGFVAHRLERLDVARLALALELMVRLAERA